MVCRSGLLAANEGLRVRHRRFAAGRPLLQADAPRAVRYGQGARGIWPRVLVAVFALLAVLASPVSADDAIVVPALDQREALRLSQAALGRGVGDYALLDQEGRPVRISDYRGKPLVVSFIYTGCFQVCPTTTRALLMAVSAAQDALGTNGFHVASIGFNQPADSPQALKSFAAQQGIARSNWALLSPPHPVVTDLTRDFGFSYVATPAGFDHILQVTVVDAEGRIYRQIYGDAFTADMLVEPLKQLITGTPVAAGASLADILERVRILCTVYDPASGRYRVDYGLLFEIAGGLTFLGALLAYFLREWRRGRNAQGA